MADIYVMSQHCVERSMYSLVPIFMVGRPCIVRPCFAAGFVNFYVEVIVGYDSGGLPADGEFF